MSKTVLQGGPRLRFYVDGEWKESKSEDIHEAFNPATGDAITQIPYALKEEVNEAVDSAQRAFESWKEVPITERVKYLFKMKDAFERHLEDLARSNTENHGKTIVESRGDLRRSIDNIDSAIAVAYTLSKGETLDQISQDIDEMMVKEPLGVFGMICPFNFPLMIPFWFIPYAIVLGDTVVVKPSEITPVPMESAARIIHEEVGLPPGVFNMVHGGREVVEALISSRLVKGVAFVGSTPVAKQVYKLAGEHGKRAIVNGGAKNSIVVMPDADVATSVPNAISSFFGNAGQRCLAGANLVTVGDAHNEFLHRFSTTARNLKVGYGMEQGVEMGPVVSRKAKERILHHIESGVEEGARVIVDGRQTRVPEHPQGFYLGATLFDAASPDMKIAKEEIFGPVATTIFSDDLEEAIDFVNKSTAFGNMASIFTASGRSAREFRRRVDSGNIGINIGVAAPAANFPFGGRKESFFGVLHAQVDTVDFFTDKKVIISRW